MGSAAFHGGAASAELGGLAGWSLDVIATIGLLGVGLLVLLESVFPPVPSEVVLPLAGFVAGQGAFSLVGAVAAATCGSVVGALLLYWIGAALGPTRLRRVAERLPLTDPEDIDRAQGWVDRHGRSAVLVGRLIPGVRSLVSIPAGVARMPLPQFIVYTALGSGVFNTVLIVLGHQLGQRWTSIGAYSDPVNYTIYGLIAVAVGWTVVRRARRRQAGTSDPA